MKGRPMKKSKQTEKKPMGRPRKHSVQAITCVVKLPPEVVAWIDQQYTTRQEGISDIVCQRWNDCL
jgi:hypothetical protein